MRFGGSYTIDPATVGAIHQIGKGNDNGTIDCFGRLAKDPIRKGCFDIEKAQMDDGLLQTEIGSGLVTKDPGSPFQNSFLCEFVKFARLVLLASRTSPCAFRTEHHHSLGLEKSQIAIHLHGKKNARLTIELKIQFKSTIVGRSTTRNFVMAIETLLPAIIAFGSSFFFCGLMGIHFHRNRECCDCC
jgi:hypothetical protein